MDAMVTGRMAPGKKEAGNLVLAELGLTASQVINELYDYLIANRKTPFESENSGEREERLRVAAASVDAIPKVSLDAHYAEMDIKQARRERLSSKFDG